MNCYKLCWNQIRTILKYTFLSLKNETFFSFSPSTKRIFYLTGKQTTKIIFVGRKLKLIRNWFCICTTLNIRQGNVVFISRHFALGKQNQYWTRCIKVGGKSNPEFWFTASTCNIICICMSYSMWIYVQFSSFG